MRLENEQLTGGGIGRRQLTEGGVGRVGVLEGGIGEGVVNRGRYWGVRLYSVSSSSSEMTYL